MALIAPVAFAAAGGLLTGGATWGMAAGWLIGSWLFNKNEDPKNQVFDPGAEEMPTFNQALRGATMPILFGTNRVSSNLVWTNAFTTIRNETKASGGGGKGGGSGMGSKGGQPSTGEVTYEYKWDLMFHLGMSDQNLQLLGAWVGTEAVDDNTIVSIISNSDSTFATYIGLTGGEGLGLNFEDSYFHGAASTASDTDNWAHFQSITGGTYRFPYTVYVGFKQLELGNTARVPQISWEVGEGGIDLSSEASDVYVESVDIATYAGGGTHPYNWTFRAKDGTLGRCYCPHYFPGAPNFSARLRNLETATGYNELKTATQFRADFDAWWGGSFSVNTTLGLNATMIEDRYLLYGRRGDTYSFEYVLYEIDNVDGQSNVTPVGSMRFGDPGLSSWYQQLHFVAISGAGTDDDYIIYTTNGGSGVGNYDISWWMGPSINQMKNSTWYLTGSNDIAQGLIYVTNVFSSPIFGSVDTRGDTTYEQDFGWTGEEFAQGLSFIVPKVTIGLLGLEYEDVAYVFVNKARCKWHLDNPGLGSSFVETQAATYPDGFVAKVTGLAWTIVDGVSILDNPSTTVTIVNDKFMDAAGNLVGPWDDDGLDEDGTANIYNSYNEYGVTNQRLRSGFGTGGNLIIFWKRIYDQSDYNKHTGAPIPTRAQIFLYNPLTEEFTRYVNIFAPVTSGLVTAYPSSDWSSGVPQLGSNEGIRGQGLGMPGGYYDDVEGRLLTSWSIRMGASNGGGDWNSTGEIGTLNITGGEDLTPPVIIYRILTSTVYGLGISESDIDSTTYGLANQYCEAESIRVSVQYRREENALQVITQLLELYGGFLIDSGGKIKFGLQEFSSATVRTIDNERLRIDQEGEPPVLITKGARQDTYNRVKINYFDRSLSYRQNFIEIADEVDMDVNGVRAQEFPAKFVMSRQTARKMAARALWGNMYARDIYDFKLGAKDADLEPGDVITLVDSYHSELQSGKQARIVSWQETEPLTFQVKAVEEVEYISTSTLESDNVTEATSNSLFKRPEPMATFGMYELPAEYQGADAQLFVGYRQQSEIMGARLYLSADGVSYALADEVQPFIVSGIMAQGVPAREPGYVEENLEVYLMPDQLSSGSFNASSPLYAQNYALDDVGASGRALGVGNIWINSEMMAYEGVNLIAQNHYRFDKVHRGWGGTHIQGHSSGDTWWKQGGGVFVDPINIDKVGTLLYYKVTGYNFAGQEYNVASVDARTYQILGTYWRPQVQAPIATYVQSPGSYLTIQSEDLGFIQKKQVVTGGSPVQFEWPQAAQEAGYGAQGYGVGGYGRFVQDTTSVNYRVEVLSSDLSTVVRCTTVDTTAFLYSTALNSEDWNGWQGSFAVRVTPFNPVGTALRSRTKILELFE